MAAVFLVSGFFHLLKFNWRVFYAYLIKKREAGLQFKWELIASGFIFRHFHRHLRAIASRVI
jgi:hypothetical protein